MPLAANIACADVAAPALSERSLLMSDPQQVAPDSQSRNPPASAPEAPNESAQLKSALKAFKKRLKMARLDAESSLGRGPMSGGGSSGIVAIMPPNQFPQAIWDELHRQGKLRRAGHGMYELAAERQ